ncbi:MAG: hypothetical protein ACOX7U_07040 [Desulfitobacteriia bacterium]|jgi:hypothetical protein
MVKKYLLYLLRWQLSTPILALCLSFLKFGVTANTIIANLVGGLIFFWVDKYIFRNVTYFPLWQVEEEIQCVDCGQIARGYRLVKAKNYDRTRDKNPEFRCEQCSLKKSDELKDRGITI